MTIDKDLMNLTRQVESRFPKGETVNVPKYLEEHGNPEAAKKWEEMNEEYGDLLKKTANQIAKTILEQMGGQRRLMAMLGANTFVAHPKGVSFRWPNKQRSKGNMVEITLTPMDEYNMTFYNASAPGGIPKITPVKKYKGLFFDQLIETFERQTGWYLRLASQNKDEEYGALLKKAAVLPYAMAFLSGHSTLMKVPKPVLKPNSIPVSDEDEGSFENSVNIHNVGVLVNGHFKIFKNFGTIQKGAASIYGYLGDLENAHDAYRGIKPRPYGGRSDLNWVPGDDQWEDAEPWVQLKLPEDVFARTEAAAKDDFLRIFEVEGDCEVDYQNFKYKTDDTYGGRVALHRDVIAFFKWAVSQEPGEKRASENQDGIIKKYTGSKVTLNGKPAVIKSEGRGHYARAVIQPSGESAEANWYKVKEIMEKKNGKFTSQKGKSYVNAFDQLMELTSGWEPGHRVEEELPEGEGSLLPGMEPEIKEARTLGDVRKILARFPSKAMDFNKVKDPDGFWKWDIDDASTMSGTRFNPKDVGDIVFWLNMAAMNWERIMKTGSDAMATLAEMTKTASHRHLYDIAKEIRRDWKKINYAAKPYLDAMSTLDQIEDNYGLDSGSSIVAYFLANASSWRGPVAQKIKKELNHIYKHAGPPTRNPYDRAASKVQAATLNKMQVKKLLEKHNIPGELSGSGTNWEIELPDEKTEKRFMKMYPGEIRGYKTGYGAWVMKPGKFREPDVDYGHPASPHHYAADDELEARFEEGVPADPTENMSPEDKEKWEKYHGQVDKLGKEPVPNLMIPHPDRYWAKPYPGFKNIPIDSFNQKAVKFFGPSVGKQFSVIMDKLQAKFIRQGNTSIKYGGLDHVLTMSKDYSTLGYTILKGSFPNVVATLIPTPELVEAYKKRYRLGSVEKHEKNKDNFKEAAKSPAAYYKFDAGEVFDLLMSVKSFSADVRELVKTYKEKTGKTLRQGIKMKAWFEALDSNNQKTLAGMIEDAEKKAGERLASLDDLETEITLDQDLAFLSSITAASDIVYVSVIAKNPESYPRGHNEIKIPWKSKDGDLITCCPYAGVIQDSKYSKSVNRIDEKKGHLREIIHEVKRPSDLANVKQWEKDIKAWFDQPGAKVEIVPASRKPQVWFQGKPVKTASEDELEARFEEGKPADPTENMSEEDAKKWRLENLKNKDKFKEAEMKYMRELAAGKVQPQFLSWSMAEAQGNGTIHMDGVVLAFDKEASNADEDIDTAFKQLSEALKTTALPTNDGKYRTRVEPSEFMLESSDKENWNFKHQSSLNILIVNKETGEIIIPTGTEEGFGGSFNKQAALTPHHDLDNPENMALLAKALRMRLNKYPMSMSGETSWIMEGKDLQLYVNFSRNGKVDLYVMASPDMDESQEPLIEKEGLTIKDSKQLALIANKALALSRQSPTLKHLMMERMATKAPSGLYGYTRQIQSDCEGCIRKTTRMATKLAKMAWEKDNDVAPFLATHAKRADSLPAKILVAAMQGLGPKVAKEAASRRNGLYGFKPKTAALGMKICNSLREEVGHMASELHSRRADKHELITGFLKQHSKESKCLYSRMLHASYPDAPASKKASVPNSVQGWLEADL